ncbi:MAG: M20/M25/M40 family metallo-hydrolase [Actinobacteria bacterium]|nr:M20/M25/M40 family metallo-hydrolase [Actinomycetota bacterium]
MDWDELGTEAVSALCEYLRIDTTNPPGNESRGAEFLAGILREEGLEYSLLETAPGRSSLLARLRGTREESPLLFLNHIDVVPADPESWSFHPFSGEIADGFVWGRGALDMKGMGIMELFAFIAAARENLPLKRDLVFLAVADEEAGGYSGARALLEAYPEELAAGVVINEGGYATMDLVPGRPFFLVASAEKYGFWLHLLRRGVGGHGSMPTGRGALERMVPALARLLEDRRPLRVNPTMLAFFERLAEHWEILAPFREDGDPATLARLIEENNLTALPALNAVLRDTVSLNMLNAGVKINVIPDRAEAFLDCRLLPETEGEEFLSHIREALADPEMEVDVFMDMERAPASPHSGLFFDAIAEAVARNYPDAAVSPFMLSGLSDSRFFRARGVPCYGIIPARVGLADLARIHGVDERIAVQDVREGVRFLFDLAASLCTQG